MITYLKGAMVDYEEPEEEEVEEEEEERGLALPATTQAILFSKAMELVDGTEGVLTRDFKVANLKPDSLAKVQFLLQAAKIFKLHAEQYELKLDRLFRQIKADAYIVAGTSPSERGKLLELLATMRREIKKETKEGKSKRTKWFPF